MKFIAKPRISSPDWEKVSGDAIRRRGYRNYDDYLTHQGAKYDVLLEKQGGHDRRTITAYRLKFWLRFRRLIGLIPRDAIIVCAGARDGTEVEVWRDIGFKNARGFDINPGPDNPFVEEGDFNKLPLSDASVDVVFSNCVDHAFDMPQMFSEARRILKPGGYFLYDISLGTGGTFEALDWDRPETVFLELLNFADHLIEVKRFRGWMQITAQKHK